MSTYQHIAQRAARVPVRRLCQVLGVPPAAYYAWQRHWQQPVAEPAWQVAVREAFAYHSQRYGTRRLRAEVQAQGHAVGRWRIRRVLKAHGLRAQQPRSFVPRTTDSDPAVRAAPNRLLGQPAPTAPNRVWVGDITYLPRQGGGWLYLAVWLDRCSRKIVGWDVRETMPEDLVSEALRLAGESRSTQAAARQLGISPKLLYRWQQAQLVAEVGSEEVARDPEVRALRARLKRAEQELDILKKALVIFSQPTR